jgi:hypothetical protein
MQFWVEFLQVGWNGGDEDFDCGVGRTDLKPTVIWEHSQNWKITHCLLNQILSISLRVTIQSLH